MTGKQWFFVCIVLLLGVAAIAIGCCSFACIYDDGLIEKVDENIQDYTLFESDHKTCRMTNCSDTANVELKYTLASRSKRHEGLPLVNSANYDIEVSVGKDYEKGTITKKDEYIQLTHQGGGNYIASLEEDKYEVSVITGSYNEYKTVVRGDYCDIHAAAARDAIKSDLEEAIQNTTFYKIFRTYVVYILLAFAILTFGLCFFIGIENDYLPEGLAPAKSTTIFTIVLAVLAIIGNACGSAYLTWFALIGTGIFAVISGLFCGNNHAYR